MAISEMTGNLTKPETLLSSGLITALIEWEDTTIQRLSIVEPDGGVVTSESKISSVGEIDVVSNESQKFEHYFAKCSKIAVGTYNFSVSLARGTLPAVGRLSITAGTEMLVKTYMLSMANQLVASVNVRQRPNGNLVFNILEIRDVPQVPGNETNGTNGNGTIPGNETNETDS